VEERELLAVGDEHGRRQHRGDVGPPLVHEAAGRVQDLLVAHVVDEDVEDGRPFRVAAELVA
jgi:hypothetical protein